MWQQWVNAILGILVLLYSFFGMSADTMTTLLVITGIVIAALGFWGAASSGKKGGEKAPAPAPGEGAPGEGAEM